MKDNEKVEKEDTTKVAVVNSDEDKNKEKPVDEKNETRQKPGSKEAWKIHKSFGPQPK
ncbi:MAG: hypothetical protein UR39_C0002G0023 [Candidatus Woesebacteria bacterium GW2011_GWA1_33_30]|uniref:Uncharacterized protein n=1 Tax=Candidatus Woesebacteria bacterium GW2011_GWA2_33_28 TaxID=1618561 RepID=A0A0G0C9S9_9BACT|nr:MAG: hypothetical protein UR38_C0002G0023 [Candidatus Woesebacteria bacterium GW2011_GWA2_33_28]KKP48733.1 MAG: hypothetical protein UR39_C0002G0023 [Candidatus Woesebacteria bacterium GW2011_GWA1_33_30]KKP50006.1 MAG: hypothetical protein UR40_C0002G0023 [Microgenomates group bacterium GW2011_GWC1_33_32]KKP51777.1 MAG: hypothetical protein UR44_C0006G0023 [Candidatus Woesebacteria bacterium GW2011_GWB1_33_38]KKP58609.1 MAG: hypothetical protein UR48_C0003G0036 [Microgenomates group bacteriu